MVLSLCHAHKHTPCQCYTAGSSRRDLLSIKCFQSVMGSINVHRRTHGKVIENAGTCDTREASLV